MKLTAILMFGFLMQVSATGSSQTVTLSESNVSLKKVFKEIQKQTGYDFLYTYDVIQNAGKVSVQVKNASLKETLDEVLEGKGLEYKIMERTVVVKRGKRKVLEFSLAKEDIIPPSDVTGKVVDENGNPIAGVSVVEKGTKNGTTTNSEGEYTILDVSGNGTLLFTSVGYITLEISVKNRSVINVRLKIELQSLNETIVIGYGTSTKKDLTGSVSSVPSNVFENPTFPDIGYAIQGQVAGMNILTGDGSPGEPVQISIRGVGSILGNTSPLFVVDGVPMPSEFNLNDLDPQSIQSIDVLKGAPDLSALIFYQP